MRAVLFLFIAFCVPSATAWANIQGDTLKAVRFDAVLQMRERQLRREYQDKVDKEDYVGRWYGVEFDEGSAPDNVIPIYSIGDSILHSTLPIQNNIRRCVTLGNVVQYYLDTDNSELKADGTPANLDGTDGNVMVEIPEFFYKIEEDTVDDVRTIRIKISEDALPDFQFSCKRYTSAYEATINRTTGKLSSVCTTNFSRNGSEVVMTEVDNYIQADDFSRGEQKTARRDGHSANAVMYRGGTNDETLDQYEDPGEMNYSRNQLGLPVANVNIQDIRNACDEGQFGYLYDTQRILNMLIQVEYKTRNIQKAISSGGLGTGATVYPNANGGYDAYEKFFSPQGGISTIPCGVTNVLGNHSGEVYYLLENVPVESTKSGDEVTLTRFANLWVPCMSYRGVEHYYGHIYKVADQVECMTSAVVGYLEGHEGDEYYAIHDVKWWYERNPYLANNINTENNFLGEYEFACNVMTPSSLMMGETGHVLHVATNGKNRYLYYCDSSELAGKPSKRKYITFNGRIVSGSLVGNHFIVSHNTVNEGDRRPSDGTRLDHFGDIYGVVVSAFPLEGGIVTGTDIYNHGETAELTATPEEGYTFLNWTEDGEEVCATPNYSFVVTDVRYLVANFSLNSYEIKVTANPEEGGTVTGDGTYHYGDTVALEVVPNAHYHFVSWTENGDMISEEAEYSFVVTGDRQLVAELTFVDAVDEMGAGVSMYPNPVGDKLNIISEQRIGQCEVYNHTGVLLKRTIVDSERAEIDVKSFSPGLYLIKLTVNGWIVTKRFAKE